PWPGCQEKSTPTWPAGAAAFSAGRTAAANFPVLGWLAAVQATSSVTPSSNHLRPATTSSSKIEPRDSARPTAGPGAVLFDFGSLANSSSTLLPSLRRTTATFGSSTSNVPRSLEFSASWSNDLRLRTRGSWANVWPTGSRTTTLRISIGENQASEIDETSI